MKTRSQTREPRFPEPLLKKMGVPLPLLLHSGEGAAARSNGRGGFPSGPVARKTDKGGLLDPLGKGGRKKTKKFKKIKKIKKIKKTYKRR